ncbi:MAG: glucokinase [Pseudomonadota bacterium]|nr:glucokinase [Pseudomonadota bacterium]
MATAGSDAARLIADIGGTNARFALVGGDGAPHSEQVLACAAYPDPAAAMEHYLSQAGGPRPRQAAIAVATPITGDRVKMTNHVWSFSLEETRRQLGFERLIAINDFTALAMALPHLKPADVHKVGRGEPVKTAPIALLGPGTGLGVSGLVPAGERWIPLQGEGGHATFSPATDREMEILKIVRQRFDHVSTERLVSGSLGFPNLYQAIATLHGVDPTPLAPADIVEQAKSGASPVCVEVLETFCAMLGTAAGNLVLALGALGGVYIGGGIIPRLGEWFDASPFRQRFEAKGRFAGYMAAVPSYVITARHPAFLGVARAFETF